MEKILERNPLYAMRTNYFALRNHFTDSHNTNTTTSNAFGMLHIQVPNGNILQSFANNEFGVCCNAYRARNNDRQAANNDVVR
jgi:hypothetical protein